MACVLLGVMPAWSAVTELVSLSSAGAAGDGGSSYPSINADGRYIAFVSDATNLVDGDTNGKSDVFVCDRLTGSVERVSISSTGAQGNDDIKVGIDLAISMDGRYVAFCSAATNLVLGDTNLHSDIFRHDRETGTTERVSVSSSEEQSDSHCEEPSISADGRYVAFKTNCTNWGSGSSGNDQVYVRDMVAGTTRRISNAPDGRAGNGRSADPCISGDASCVAFESLASDLVSGDTNDTYDVFVYDMLTGEVERASVSSAGDQADGISWFCRVSANGRYAVFESFASNLVGADTNACKDIFVHDRLTGNTERVSVSSAGEQTAVSMCDSAISADGRYVAFLPEFGSIIDRSENVLLRDRLAGTTERVTVTSTGEPGVGTSFRADISADGRFVAFDSSAWNLGPEDLNPYMDVYVRDRSGSGYACPVSVALSSSSETLGTTPFTLTSLYRDANGFSDISRCYLLLNDSLGQANAAFLYYNRALNRIYLKNDANTSWGTGYAPGSKVTLENSQCYVYMGSTTVSGSGNDLTVNWRIALKSAFAAKSLNAYMYVSDAATHWDGWERMAVFYNIPPEALGMSPSTGPIPMDNWTSFTSYYSDQNGYQDLRKCYLLVNDSLTQSNAMFLLYDRKSNRVYLKNDENTSWGTGYAPGTDVILENSQCMVRVKSIAVSHSGNNMAITWSFRLKSEAMGKKNLYSWMYVTDSKEANSGYKRVGTHFTPIAPVCVSLSPSSGTVSTGVKTPFTALYSDDNGYGDIHKVYLQLSVTSSQANAVLLMYDARQNKVFLRDDANKTWGNGGVPGTAVTLENSQCTVELASMGRPSGVTTEQLEVSWPIKLKWGMSGPRLCERIYVQDNALLASGWHVMGYVRPL